LPICSSASAALDAGTTSNPALASHRDPVLRVEASFVASRATRRRAALASDTGSGSG